MESEGGIEVQEKPKTGFFRRIFKRRPQEQVSSQEPTREQRLASLRQTKRNIKMFMGDSGNTVRSADVQKLEEIRARIQELEAQEKTPA